MSSLVPVAQWIARRTSNPKVLGSTPSRDATSFYVKDAANECFGIWKDGGGRKGEFTFFEYLIDFLGHQNR